MDYLRPKTIDEAISLLTRGVPLAGGIQLTPQRYELDTVIDLQALGLDGLTEHNDTIVAGAMTRLQQIVTSEINLPVALREACRYEAALNIRNQATLGGVLMGAGGRSPLLTVLSALDPEVKLAPGDEILKISDLFNRRFSTPEPFLLLEVSFDLPACLAYDYVARSPMDRPLVCAAAARTKRAGEDNLQVAVGGYGEQPLHWSLEGNIKDPDGLVKEASLKASELYRSAGDAFATAEYRSAIAGLLARRVVQEVVAGC